MQSDRTRDRSEDQMDTNPIGSISAAAHRPAPPQGRVDGETAKSAAPSPTDAARLGAARATGDAPSIPQRDPRSLQYAVDRGTHRVIATVVDDQNKTVVRQIPNEDVLRIAKEIDRMQGFLVEDKA